MSRLTLFLLGGPHIVFFGIWRPLNAWRRRASADNSAPLPDRTEYMRMMILQIGGVGFLSLATLLVLALASSPLPSSSQVFIFGRTAGSVAESWRALLPSTCPPLRSWMLGLVAYAIVAWIDCAHARQSLSRGAFHSHFSTPRSATERWWWIGLSVVVGLTEEVTWRGVQPELIARLTGAPLFAVLTCAAAFGVGHMDQGRRWALTSAGIAVLFHALVWLSGSLWVAAAVHVAVNVTTGLWSGRFARRCQAPSPR